MKESVSKANTIAFINLQCDYEKGNSYLTITKMEMTCNFSSLCQKKKNNNSNTENLHENQAKQFIVRSINLLYPSKKKIQPT